MTERNSKAGTRRLAHAAGVAAVALALAATLGCSKLGPGEYAIKVTEAGFEPAELKVPRGKPITLVVTRKTDKTCATEIVVQGNSIDLPLKQAVKIPVPEGVTDTLHYECGMQMFQGTVVAN